jgi:hypothetical protein
MKRLALTVCLTVVSAALCYAGPERYSGKEKEVIQPVPPPCEWYRAGEWDLDVWGAYAFADEEDENDFDINNFDFEAADREFDLTGRPVFLGDSGNDRILGRDNAWGGGGDLKYFWSRYFGAGVEGFVLSSDEESGAFLGTLTARYPIGCTRFAPYAFGGFGIFSGGEPSHTEFFFAEHHSAPGVEAGEAEFFVEHDKTNKHARFIGQLGAGLQFRLTRPSTMSKLAVGLMADFTWNFLGGTEDDGQDFGMTRFGLNLSY